MKQIFKEDECVVCIEKDVSQCLYQCKHACVCDDCAVLITKRNSLCPLCGEKIDHIKSLKSIQDEVDNPVAVPMEMYNKYAITREEFIRKFGLRIEKLGNDLVITANNVENYHIKETVANTVFEYYLGTSLYSRTNVNISFEMVGGTLTITPEIMEKLDQGFSLEDLTSPGYDKLTFKGFFKSVSEDIVGSHKLCQHLIHQYFQDYLTRNTNNKSSSDSILTSNSTLGSSKRSFKSTGMTIKF